MIKNEHILPERAGLGRARRASVIAALAAIAGFALMAAPARGTVLEPSDPKMEANFGYSGGLYGDRALIGAIYATAGETEYAGAAYYYKGLDGQSGTITQSVKLISSDASGYAYFGSSVSLYGDNALVGAEYATAGAVAQAGAAYYYKGLDSQSGTITQSVKLVASDATTPVFFGSSVSLYGDRALIGAIYATAGETEYAGAAYYYKGLDSQSGTITQSVKLISSDASGQAFGQSVSLYGDHALVGAISATAGGTEYAGAAYYYKGLDSQSGTIIQSLKLVASDASMSSYFGRSVSLYGDHALVGAMLGTAGETEYAGAAYYYKGLDSQSGSIAQNVKLIASDVSMYAYFGQSVSLCGDHALVGAANASAIEIPRSGAVYYYSGLSARADGVTVTETIRFTASDEAADANFGRSVHMDGTAFVIGASQATVDGMDAAGKAYVGDIRAFTTLNTGNTMLGTGGLSFVSQDDWVIGQSASGNKVTINRNVAGTGAADVATVTAAGKAVYIGQNAGANGNALVVEGRLTANTVFVGAEGNRGNVLMLGDNGVVASGTLIHLAYESALALQSVGELDFSNLLASFGDCVVMVMSQEGASEQLTALNADSILQKWYADGYTYFTAVPEPSAAAVLLGTGILGFVMLRRRR